jgi:hypothetical protein
MLPTARLRLKFLGSRADWFAELDVGQLIKDPYFTLFESVGALEVCEKHMEPDWDINS